jgi:hypothetical protein
VNTLADSLSEIISLLQVSSLVVSSKVVETSQFSRNQFILKVRAELVTGEILQVRNYQNQFHLDYAYQLFADGGYAI